MEGIMQVINNQIFKDVIFTFFATIFFSMIMNAPNKTIIQTSIIASIGYSVCMIVVKLGNELAGYFIGTSIIVMLSAFLSNRNKIPSIIYIFPAVIPLVPGIGLYRTILALVQNNIGMLTKNGISTILIAITMAMAMAFINILSNITTKRNKILI